MMVENALCQSPHMASVAQSGALRGAAGRMREGQPTTPLICRLLSAVPSSSGAPAAAEPSQQQEERRKSSNGASSSTSSSHVPSESSGSTPHASRGKQHFSPAYPFGGKRHPPSPRPHAGGPTPDQVSAQLGPPQVSRLDKVKGYYQVPRKPVFAVVELGPTQFKVGKSDQVQAVLLSLHADQQNMALQA